MLGSRWHQSMLGRAKPLWLVAWFKQDKLWTEQGHARGFAFTAVAAALSGCNVASPQPWTAKGSSPGPKERLEKRGQGMGMLRIEG